MRQYYINTGKYWKPLVGWSHKRLKTWHMRGILLFGKIVNLLSKKSSCWIAAQQIIGLLCTVFRTMKLMMYIGNDLIESVPLELKDIPRPGYVGSFKRALKMKYIELIQQYPEPPEFLVIPPISIPNPEFSRV